jgi:hypothetical protein
MRSIYVFWRGLFWVFAWVEAAVGISVLAHWYTPAVFLKVSFGFIAVFVIWVVLRVSLRVRFREDRELAAAEGAESRRRWESKSPWQREKELQEARTSEILAEQARVAERNMPTSNNPGTF